MNANAQRVRRLQHNGIDVADNDQFIVVANNYRVNGGGSFASIPQTDVMYTSRCTTREILINYMRKTQTVAGYAAHPMHFAHLPNTSATFHTAAMAQHHLPPHIQHCGAGIHGFHKYKLTF